MMKKVIVGFFVITLLISSVAYADRDNREMEDADMATSTRSELRKNREERKDKMATSTRSELRKNQNASSTRDVDETCVSEAILKREDTILSSWNMFSDKMDTMLITRKSSLIEAWKITDSKERKSELKEVWSKVKKDKKEAREEYKMSKKEIWVTYKKTVKACGGSVGDDASGEKEEGEKIEI